MFYAAITVGCFDCFAQISRIRIPQAEADGDAHDLIFFQIQTILILDALKIIFCFLYRSTLGQCIFVLYFIIRYFGLSKLGPLPIVHLEFENEENTRWSTEGGSNRNQDFGIQ